MTADTAPLIAPVFVSDLHLAVDRPRTTGRFMRFLHEDAPRYRELVILGDLFEFWIGDDAAAAAAPVIAALREQSGQGRRVLLMHGNRDPLLGHQFAAACGAQLLADPTIAEVAGTLTLLAHGDAWCTRDTAYQAFRATIRQPQFQRDFLARPLADRIAFAQSARQRSETDKSMKAADIMDVTADAVMSALKDAGVRRIVHGHTHRPGAHVIDVDGALAERWVLPDWDFESDAPRGGYLDLAGGVPRLVLFDD